MSAPEWQIAFLTGNLVATYRSIRIVINLGETSNPIEMGWFIGGREVQSMRVNCPLELAKKLGVEAVNVRIPVDEEWQQAEKRDRESDLS